MDSLKMKEYRRAYYLKNKDKIKEKMKEYRLKNKNKIYEYQKLWKKEHSEHLSAKRKELYNDHYKEQYYQKYSREYYKKNKDKLINYATNYRNSKKSPLVYKYTEINSNEIVYIGSTENLQYRINNRNSTEDTIFANIYREEPEKFIFEIICTTNTREEAYELEKELIRQYQPKYNVLKYKEI